MKCKLLIGASFLAFAGIAMAASPTMSILNVTSSDAMVVNLKIQNAKKIKDVSFNGLDDFNLVGRNIEFNSPSPKTNHTMLTINLSVIPTKAESVVVYATANLDDKKYTSNKINLTITQAQVDNYQVIQKKQLKVQQQRMQKLQETLNKQFEEQQKVFESINAMMQKQQSYMLKTMQNMDKNFSF